MIITNDRALIGQIRLPNRQHNFVHLFHLSETLPSPVLCACPRVVGWLGSCALEPSLKVHFGFVFEENAPNHETPRLSAATFPTR